MAKARTDVESVVKLIINGEQAKTSMKEITDSLRRYETEFKNLKKEDNPKAYEEKAAAIRKMKDALKAASDEMKGANVETKQFNASWKDIAKGVIAGGVITEVAQRLLSYATVVKDAYADTQRFRTILTTAFNGETFKADSNLKLIQSFAKDTPYQLNEITESFVKLVNRGFVPVRKELTEMGDLSASQGKSLDQLVEAMLDAQTGEFERLKEFGIRGSKNGEIVTLSFRGVTHEVENTEEAIRNAILSFGAIDGIRGSMENLSKTVEGMASNIEDSWNQIFVALGQRSEGFINGFYRSYGKLMSWINDEVLNNKISDQLEKERIELVKLDIQINSTNTTQEDRIRLIKQLQSQYPTLLANLNAEKVSNLEVSKAIKLLNDQMINKIILQKKDEEIEKQNQVSAEKKMDLLAKEDAIRTQIAKLQTKYPQLKASGKTEEEQLKSMVKQYRQLYGAKNDAFGSPIGGALAALSKYDQLQQRTNQEQEKGNALLKQRSKLMKDLGISEVAPDSAGDKVTEAGKKMSEQTIGELKARLSGLNKQLDDTIKGSAQYKKIMSEIAQINGILNSDKVASKAGAKAESEAAKALKEFEKLDKEYEKLGLSRLNDQLSKNEKEVASAEQKYDALITKEREFLEMKGVTAAQVKATEERIAQIEINKAEDVKNIRIRQNEEMTEKIQELRNGLAQVHEHELQKERDRINKFYDQQENENAGNEEVLASLKQARITDLADAEIREKRRLEEEKLRIESEYGTINGDKDAADLAKINKKYDDEILALKEKFSKELQATAEFQAALDAINANRAAAIQVQEQEKEQSKRDFQIDMAQKASDTVFSIMENNRNDELNMRLSDLDKQREKELDNKNLTEAQKKAINDKYDKKVKEERTKAFEANKRASIAQAFINGALGVTAAWTNPFTAPFVIPTIIATTAAQIAVIAAQKPKFAKGGFVPDGPSHSSGGIKMIDSVTGAMVGEMEGGEPILSKDTYKNNKATIDALLYSGQRLNGANISLDTNTLGQAERYYRTGGIAESVSGSLTIPAPVVNVNTQTEAQDNSEMLELMREMVGAAKNAWNFRTFEEAQQRIGKIRETAGA